MKNTYIVVGALCAVIAAPALARIEYASYEGRNAVLEGEGGTKIVKDGVDFWTSGSPPRRFKVIGVLTDTRKDKLLSGKAMGSSAIAKKVKEVGGGAAILANQDKAYAGTTSVLNAFGGNGYGSAVMSGRDVHEITSKFIVIQYLEGENG